MLDIVEIRRRLQDRNLSEVARRIGFTRAHLSNIYNGKTDGSYKVLKLLSDYLEGKDFLQSDPSRS
jgi:transcriptional regulator with XRE-family HTH domain